MFIQNPLVSFELIGHKSNSKLVIGLVVGVAVPVIVGVIVAYGFWNLRRKSRRAAINRVERLKNGVVITQSE